MATGTPLPPDIEELLKQAEQQGRATDAALQKVDSAKAATSLSEVVQGRTSKGETIFYDRSLILIQTGSILGFTSLICVLSYLLMCRRHTADQVLRVLTIPVIVGTAAFLVIAGYGVEQINPVIGLLGTIAGYVLGYASRNPEPPASREQAAAAEKPKV